MLEVENVSGRSSNTDRKYTQVTKDYPFTVSLDGLSFMVDCVLQTPTLDKTVYQTNDRVVLEWLKRGTSLFLNSWLVYLHGEPVAYIHTHTRNPKVIKNCVAQIKIHNHILYSNDLHQTIYEVMNGTSCGHIRNFSELHIALDGANHIHSFLNNYIRQSVKYQDSELFTEDQRNLTEIIKMKGSANFDCKRYNKTTFCFDNFKTGSVKKNVVVYNKTSEIQESQKNYIVQKWNRAGIDSSKTIWRTELRLGSEAIREITDFDINCIDNANYLLSIFKTHINNFFEFAIMQPEGDSNISRATTIDLFNLHSLKIPDLQKEKRQRVDGLYKAKLAIHLAYANNHNGSVTEQGEMVGNINFIHDNCQRYGLLNWYEKKREEWDNLYKTLVIPAKN